MTAMRAQPGRSVRSREICPRDGGDDAAHFRSVFTGTRRVINAVGIAVWAATLVYFWVWWLRPEHVYSPGRYAIVTFVLLWMTLIPAYYILIFARARVPLAGRTPPEGSRVAIIVTKAPSEPFAVVAKTLEGALDQNGFPHDTWLADEDPAPATIAWCRARGVNISSRKGVAEYHRETWPRRTRCKEGNLAYFYDHFGYDRYDFVAQFDADHIPEPDYLKHAISPFEDPRVGYVSAPSICDANAAQSWSARGRLYLEASMHGSLQAGYNSGWAPLCIGSHYTVRTAALRSVGGLGPELAEDHSTTLILNASGWNGVHAVDAIAHGEGPETFSDLIVQEFQWSRSLVTILLRYSPVYARKLTLRKKFQFYFSQVWYPSFSGIMAIAVALPIYALLTGAPYANVTFVDYFLRILPLSLTLLILAYWWRSTGLFRPADAKIVSWEGMAFLFLRWPWALLGSLAAVVDRFRKAPVEFRVTPKGEPHKEPLPFRVVAPYVGVSLFSAGAAWAVGNPGTAAGFYIFCLVTALIYALLVALVIYRHARENGLSLFPRSASLGAALVSIALMGSTISGAAYTNGVKGLAAINVGISALTLTETRFPVSGAGRITEPIIRFKPKWHGF
jgi:cellulose synthase (UDP-forming)